MALLLPQFFSRGSISCTHNSSGTFSIIVGFSFQLEMREFMSFFLVVQTVVPLEFDCVCLLFVNTFVAKMELDQNLPLFYRRQMVVGKQAWGWLREDNESSEAPAGCVLCWISRRM